MLITANKTQAPSVNSVGKIPGCSFCKQATRTITITDTQNKPDTMDFFIVIVRVLVREEHEQNPSSQHRWAVLAQYVLVNFEYANQQNLLRPHIHR